MKERIHEKILNKCEDLIDWYNSQISDSYVPFYASFDIRDAGFKIGNVDGNIFPAGFNNICQMDKDTAPELIESYLKNRFPDKKELLLLSEDHLKNTFYWENVASISDLLVDSGYNVKIGMLSPEIEKEIQVETYTGRKVDVLKVSSDNGQLMTSNGVPDLVISNNDFSNSYEGTDFSNTLMTPLKELGWYQRKKMSYFKYYNQYVEKFSEFIDEDPWLFKVETQSFIDFDVSDENSRDKLAQQVDVLISDIQNKYDEHGIKEKPYVFVKNNSGTYGLGILTASSGDDVRSWNYKSKKKMKATKGGGGISQVIIQEGIPSALTEEGATAEPVLYMLGAELAGGFLRTHEKKDALQSLNSPGAVYKKLCLSDLRVRAEGCVLENVYGWVAKLGLLAISQEAKDLNIQ